MVGAEIVMFGSVFQHMIDRGEHRCGDGTDGDLWAALAAQAVELCLVVAVFFPAGSPRTLDEHGLEPGIALAQTRGFALAGALVLAGAQSGPGEQVTSGWEATHVEADFRQDRRRGQDADAGYRAQQTAEGLKGGLTGRDL